MTLCEPNDLVQGTNKCKEKLKNNIISKTKLFNLIKIFNFKNNNREKL